MNKPSARQRVTDRYVHNFEVEKFEGGLFGRRLHLVKIVRRIISASGVIWSSYSFMIPTLAAEGHGFTSSEAAVAAAMRYLFILLICVIGLLA